MRAGAARWSHPRSQFVDAALRAALARQPRTPTTRTVVKVLGSRSAVRFAGSQGHDTLACIARHGKSLPRQQAIRATTYAPCQRRQESGPVGTGVRVVSRSESRHTLHRTFCPPFCPASMSMFRAVLSAEPAARPNHSLKPTRYGSHRLAAPGHGGHRPSAASRRLPQRAA